MEDYMENTVFSRENKFQKGMVIWIKSLIGLHKYMQQTYQIPYLMTSHVNQDYLESFNGDMRLSDGRGGVRRPTLLQLNYRIQRHSQNIHRFFHSTKLWSDPSGHNQSIGGDSKRIFHHCSICDNFC